MPDWMTTAWPIVVSLLAFAVALAGATHAALNRRDSRAALLWIGLIWLAPFVGCGLYVLFWINRVRRRARILRGELEPVHVGSQVRPVTPERLAGALPARFRRLHALQRLIDAVAVRPLLGGNRIAPLVNGDEAYGAMWEAIDGAQRSVTLSTYLFGADRVGREFADRLGAAARRGVEVRVLIDDAGAHYSLPSVSGLLRRAGVRQARFHPRFWLLPTGTLNMRNHRKICVVDGRVGFTGGMNIHEKNTAATGDVREVDDVHFRVEGPVVAHLQEVFAEDWSFTTDETLAGETWFPPLEPMGDAYARGIADGPDEDIDKLSLSILGSLAVARRSIKVTTPYFLPTPALVSALNVAALRGVDVDILIPARCNLRLVQWAMQATLWQVLERGCRVWLTPPPFDHAKLLLVDGFWTLFGSANWDPRSLRLNFEFNVECYDAQLAGAVDDLFEARRSKARALGLDDVDRRPFPARVRDGIARLFTPIL